MLDKLFGGTVAANDNFRKCERCGGPLPQQTGPGRKAKYCSEECRHPPVFTEGTCAHCEKAIVGRRRKFCDDICRGEDLKEKRRLEPKPGYAQISGECKECGNRFVGRIGRLYCGDKCARRQRDFEYRRGSRAPARECQWCGESFSRRPTTKDAALFCSRGCGHEYLRAQAEVVRVARFTVFRPRCDVCDKPFSASGATAKYCSDECSSQIARERAIARWAANNNIDRSPRQCPECHSIFSPAEYGDRRSVYCSNECGGRYTRRITRAARKARVRVASIEKVDPIKVFERDKWKCQICGVKTPRKLRGTMDDRAPELDHIMPLSRGGAHSYMNTQCACRKCNGLKSDTPPKQPSLFAYAA